MGVVCLLELGLSKQDEGFKVGRLQMKRPLRIFLGTCRVVPKHVDFGKLHKSGHTMRKLFKVSKQDHLSTDRAFDIGGILCPTKPIGLAGRSKLHGLPVGLHGRMVVPNLLGALAEQMLYIVVVWFFLWSLLQLFFACLLEGTNLYELL